MKKEFELYQDEEGNVYDITTDLEQIIIKDLYKAMKRNNEKQDEIERLNNIIDNAIKGIEDFYYGDEEYKKYDYTLAYKIYHILKGVDKE